MAIPLSEIRKAAEVARDRLATKVEEEIDRQMAEHVANGHSLEHFWTNDLPNGGEPVQREVVRRFREAGWKVKFEPLLYGSTFAQIEPLVEGLE